MGSRAQVAPRSARLKLRGATGALPSKGAYGHIFLYKRSSPFWGGLLLLQLPKAQSSNLDYPKKNSKPLCLRWRVQPPP